MRCAYRYSSVIFSTSALYEILFPWYQLLGFLSTFAIDFMTRGGGGICADLKAVALWEVDGPEGSVTGVPNSMYLVTGKTLNNSSQFYTLSITWFWLFTNFEIRTEFSLGSELSVSILQCPENSQMFTCETRLKSSDCLLFYSNVNFFPSSCRHTTELYSIHGLQKYWM